MKKVECISCGGTGVILRRSRPCAYREAHQCRRCKGFGFVLMELTEFSKFKKAKHKRYSVTGGLPLYRWFKSSIPEYREFTGLAKVRNIKHVTTDHGTIPYGVFYKEHRNPR